MSRDKLGINLHVLVVVRVGCSRAFNSYLTVCDVSVHLGKEHQEKLRNLLSQAELADATEDEEDAKRDKGKKADVTDPAQIARKLHRTQIRKLRQQYRTLAVSVVPELGESLFSVCEEFSEEELHYVVSFIYNSEKTVFLGIQKAFSLYWVCNCCGYVCSLLQHKRR